MIASEAPAQPVSARVRWARLAARQAELCLRLALGQTRAEICAAMRIGLKTHDAHRRAAFERLGVRTDADLVRLAVAAGAIRVEIEP